MSDATTFPYIQQQLIRSFGSAYLFFGNIGNILNCFVFSQKSLRGSSCSTYFLALSITNIILLDYAVITRMYTNEQPNPSSYFLLYCKLSVYIVHALLMISRTYIVLICIDRFCMCSSSVLIRRFSTPRMAVRVVILIPFIWLIIAIHIPIFNTIQREICVMPDIYSFIYSIYNICVAAIIPPLMMTVFTLLTYRTMKKMRARIIPTTQTMQIRIQKRDQQLYRVSICQVIVYILSSWLLPYTQLYFGFIKKASPQTIVELYLNLLSTTLLVYLNNSATFYIYICMSSSFRNEFKKIILIYCLCRPNDERVSTNPEERNVNAINLPVAKSTNNK